MPEQNPLEFNNRRDSAEILEDIDSTIKESGADKHNTYREVVEGGDSEVLKKAGLLDLGKVKLHRALDSISPFSNTDKMESKTMETIAEKHINKELETLESLANDSMKLKSKIEKRNTKKEAELEKQIKEIKRFKGFIEASLKDFELGLKTKDKNEGSKIEEHREKLENELLNKQNILEELKDNLEDKTPEEQAEEGELEHKQEELALEKERMREPMLEKLEKIGDSLETFQSLYQECSERRRELSERVRASERGLRRAERNKDSENYAGLKEDFENNKKAASEELKKFQEAEKELKEKILIIKAEKNKVHRLLSRVDRAGVSAKERKEAREEELREKKELDDREEKKNKLITACGGEDSYNSTIAGLDQFRQNILSDYFDLAPQDGENISKLEESQLSGKNPAQVKRYIKGFLDRFATMEPCLEQDKWTEVLFGKKMIDMDYIQKKRVMEVINKLPQNILGQKYSKDWATKLYINYKQANDKNTDKEAAKTEATAKINNYIQNN